MASLLGRRADALQWFGPGAFPIECEGLRAAELPLECLIRVQGRLSNPAFAQALAGAMKQPPPAPCRHVSVPALQAQCAWIGPQEWLFIGKLENEEALLGMLQNAIAGLGQVTLASDSRQGLVLTGPHAPHLLAKGSALDVDPAVLADGHCAVTRFAAIAAMVMRTAEHEYRLYVDSSFAQYLMNWTLDACMEWRIKT